MKKLLRFLSYIVKSCCRTRSETTGERQALCSLLTLYETSESESSSCLMQPGARWIMSVFREVCLRGTSIVKCSSGSLFTLPRRKCDFSCVPKIKDFWNSRRTLIVNEISRRGDSFVLRLGLQSLWCTSMRRELSTDHVNGHGRQCKF